MSWDLHLVNSHVSHWSPVTSVLSKVKIYPLCTLHQAARKKNSPIVSQDLPYSLSPSVLTVVAPAQHYALQLELKDGFQPPRAFHYLISII